jgi:hypothetical protein
MSTNTSTTYIPDISGWVSYYEKQAATAVNDEKPAITSPILTQKPQKTDCIIDSVKLEIPQPETVHREQPDTDIDQLALQDSASGSDLEGGATTTMPSKNVQLVTAAQSAVQQAKSMKNMKTGIKRVSSGGGSTKSKKSKSTASTSGKSGKKTKKNKKAVRDIYNKHYVPT